MSLNGKAKNLIVVETWISQHLNLVLEAQEFLERYWSSVSVRILKKWVLTPAKVCLSQRIPKLASMRASRRTKCSFFHVLLRVPSPEGVACT